MYGDIGDEKTKSTSQETLYTCLDTALKLTAPFMPFVSEELWQRLPRRSSDKAASVHVSRYPKEGNFSQDSKAEQDIELMMAVIKVTDYIYIRQSISYRYRREFGLSVVNIN